MDGKYYAYMDVSVRTESGTEVENNAGAVVEEQLSRSSCRGAVVEEQFLFKGMILDF